jgi:16S rRNA (cytidine1402-2'-O)-methyltransferase
MRGFLYVAATPIGNLDDITLRALDVLKKADAIACEDTRRSLKLLNNYGIKKPLISYWSEREKVKAEEVIGRIKAGASVALITDAGTPGISDPGSVLIRRAIEEGIEVVAVPGPSAVTAALSIAGMPAGEFTFIGFLPPKRSQRQKRLRSLALEPRTLVFYEAPHRVIETLEDMAETFGPDRKAAVTKELTKMHEQTFRGGLREILDILEPMPVAGEFVIVTEGKKKTPSEAHAVEEDAVMEVLDLMKRGLKRKEAVTTVASEYGISKKELYERSLLRERKD